MDQDRKTPAAAPVRTPEAPAALADAAPAGRRRRGRRGGQKNARKSGKPLPKIFFCGDPHGEFGFINEAVERYHPDAVVILGDLQPQDDIEKVLGPALALTQVWWIPGNHDTDTEECYDRLWHGVLASRNLHGRVGNVAGIRIAGLGGVFRGQIWMPDLEPNYRSAQAFVKRSPRSNLWRGGLPRRHRSSIFPSVYEGLARQKADVLVTHEAAGCHHKGFCAIDRLAKSLNVRWLFHGHQHEDHVYGQYKGMTVRAVGYRGIVDLEGHVIREAEIDPRDLFVMQSAGEEPPPEVLDSVQFEPLPRPQLRRRRIRPCRKEKVPAASMRGRLASGAAAVPAEGVRPVRPARGAEAKGDAGSSSRN